MTVRVNGIEAQKFTTEVKSVHQLVPACIYAVTFDTAGAYGENGGESVAGPEQVASSRQLA